MLKKMRLVIKANRLIIAIYRERNRVIIIAIRAIRK